MLLPEEVAGSALKRAVFLLACEGLTDPAERHRSDRAVPRHTSTAGASVIWLTGMPVAVIYPPKSEGTNMPQSATYTSVTKFDSDGDGVPETSASGTRTQEFDDQGNLVHDRSTIDLNGDSIPDFVEESRFS
jgi:hypothetical protein